MQISAADIVGIVGTALVVLAYGLQQFDKLTGDSLPYLAMNLGGAILLLISLCVNFNLASFIIELFWIAASLVGLYKYYQKRN